MRPDDPLAVDVLLSVLRGVGLDRGMLRAPQIQSTSHFLKVLQNSLVPNPRLRSLLDALYLVMPFLSIQMPTFS